MKLRDEAWCDRLLSRLTERFGWEVPAIWSERINLARAPALYRRLMKGASIELRTLLRAASNRDERLACEILYLHRDDDNHLLIPEADIELRAGDELLLVGSPDSRREFGLILSHEHALTYVLSGKDLPGGWIWERLSRRRSPDVT